MAEGGPDPPAGHLPWGAVRSCRSKMSAGPALNGAHRPASTSSPRPLRTARIPWSGFVSIPGLPRARCRVLPTTTGCDGDGAISI